MPFPGMAQQLSFSQPHGICDAPFQLTITRSDDHPGLTIRYTLDGSEPTLQSAAYSSPLTVSGTTIVRAALVADTGRVSPVVTATYLFLDDVLQQSDSPAGYPSQWGRYTTIGGTAKADYGMDPDMTTDRCLKVCARCPSSRWCRTRIISSAT